MNLIEQLSIEAKDVIPAGLTVEQWIEQYNNNLCRLIVNICAEIADKEQDNSVGCGYITKTKGMLIKQHFGL